MPPCIDTRGVPCYCIYMSTQRKQTEAEILAATQAMCANARKATTQAPAGYEATCPECGGDSNATLINRWGHCMKCHNAKFVALADSHKG